MAAKLHEAGVSIYARFIKFHDLNPHVYEKFKNVAFKLVHKGHKRLSSKSIIEYIRYNIILTTQGSQFKINNNYTAHYTRLFLSEYPHYRKYFIMKKTKDEFNPLPLHRHPEAI